MKDTKLTSDLLVAHRGYQAKYPENTQLSLLKAIQAGASYIELDVQFTADKLPIIYHDLSLQRVSGVEGYVNKLDREQLLSISAYEPKRLGDKYQDETIDINVSESNQCWNIPAPCITKGNYETFLK